jgi:hypothetical protein
VKSDTILTARFYSNLFMVNIYADPYYMGKTTGTSSGMYHYNYKGTVVAEPLSSNYKFVC